MGILSLLSGAIQALSGWLGWQKARQERFNAPDMVQNKQAATDLKEKESIESVVGQADKTKDLTKERELMGE